MPLISANGKDHFSLDLSRGSININKVKYQGRGRVSIVLARLDLEGPEHENPDGTKVPTPHLHLYREGYADKWAFLVPIDSFSDLANILQTYDDFLRYLNVTMPQNLRMVLMI